MLCCIEICHKNKVLTYGRNQLSIIATQGGSCLSLQRKEPVVYHCNARNQLSIIATQGTSCLSLQHKLNWWEIAGVLI